MRTTDCAYSIWRFALPSTQLYRKYFGLALSCAAVLLVLCGATPVLAISGETPDGEGVYEIPQERCDELTEASGMPAGFAGDVLFTCDADRNGCRLTFDELDEGLALGFCENKFDLNPYLYEGAIEENVAIEATSFGNDIGVLRSDDTGVDILCETFVDGGEGVKVCRKIVEGECSEGDCPDDDDTNDFIPTVASDCEDLQELLAGVVTGDPAPNISFGLWIDVDAAGQPGSEALFVCDGFKWEDADPADPDENGVVQYQFTKYIIDTPGCIKIGGTCYRYQP